MRQLVKVIVDGVVSLLIAAALTVFVAFLIYSFLPDILLTLLFAIPPFLWSLRDLWWTVSLVLAALGIWAYLDEITGMDAYSGGVLRGRDTQRSGLWSRWTSPPRKAQRTGGSAGLTSKPSGAVPVSATPPYRNGASNTPASGVKPSSGLVGPRVSKVRHRRHP